MFRNKEIMAKQGLKHIYPFHILKKKNVDLVAGTQKIVEAVNVKLIFCDLKTRRKWVPFNSFVLK